MPLATSPYEYEPLINASFRLSIDGVSVGNFAECTGLAAEVAVEEYAEGGENRFVHRFPDRHTQTNLVLKRGADVSTDLWDWFEIWYKTGQVEPRDGLIELLSSVGPVLRPVRAWAFTRGWPSKMTGPDLNAGSPGVALESIEIVHRGIRSAKVEA